MKKFAWVILTLAVAMLLTRGGSLLSQEQQEWWERPQLVTYAERLVGACYPWLVTEHFLINLATGETKDGIGGDTAQGVEGCEQHIIVRATYGVYVFSRATGLIVDAVHLDQQSLAYVGSSGDTVAAYDSLNSAVHVKIIGTKSTAVIRVQQPVLNISYSFVGYVPVVAYSVVSTDGAATYVVSNPGVSSSIPARGTGAVLISGNRVYVESQGILVLEVTNPLTLAYRELFHIPLPVRLTRFIAVVGDYLLGSSDGILVRINVNERSGEFRRFETVGVAEPTPVGYYVPATRTTYVITESGTYPVPGYAVAKLNRAVFTNILRRDGTIVPALWALNPAVLVVTVPLNGVLYDGEYAVKVSLAPGTYRMPRGSVISDGVKSLVLSEPEVVYPPAESKREPVSVSNVRFYVSSFPSRYLPLDRFTDVLFASSGAGRLLIIQSDRAIVYAGYGVSASIPGAWVYGGVGDCVVLYDGASFRLYDYSGEPIASYSYYLVGKPDYVTCRRVSADYAVEVYVNLYRERITVTPAGAVVEQNPERHVADPRGATVYYTATPRVEYAGIVVPVPQGARDIRVSGLWATWLTAGVNILSIPDSVIFVLLNPPAGATAYPLNGELFAVYFYNEGRLDILPYRAWFVQRCYVDVEAPQDADIFLNDRYVATGSARVYVPCNAKVVLEARQIYHKPKRAEVLVTEPTKLTLLPEPMVASVVLNVVAPKGLNITSVVMRVDGTETVWNVGEVRTMIAKPTLFEVVSFMPADACTKEAYNVTLVEGLNRLNVFCRLVSPVLALTSSVPATVKLYVVGALMPLQVVHVAPGSVSYVLSPVGDVRLVSEPTVPNYVPKELNVSVFEFKVYELDVTPYPMSKIIVQSSVATASITVYDETGNVRATGTGVLEVEVLPGKYVVFVQAPDHEPFSTQVDVPPGDAATVVAVLRALAVEEGAPPERPFWERIEFQATAVAIVAAVAVAVLWWRRRKTKEVAEELVKGEESA